MTESRQWSKSPRRSLEILFVRLVHYSKYESQTGTLSLNWTLPRFVTSWLNRALEVLSEVCLVSPEVLKIGSGRPVTLELLCPFPPFARSFSPFAKFWGISGPLRSRGPQSPWRDSKEAAEILPHLAFLTSTMNLEGIFLQLRYLVQSAQIVPEWLSAAN